MEANPDCNGGSDEPEPEPCDIFEEMGDLPPNCDEEDEGGDTAEDTVDMCPEDGVQTSEPCASDEDGDETNSGSSSGGDGGSGGGGGGGSGGGSGGSVLGTSDGGSCSYLTGFIKPGADNDFGDVARLQAFLKVFEGANVEVNGSYDTASIAAVHAFQTKYASEILVPWGISQSTGYVYLTTRKKVNEIYCDRNLQFPLTEEEQQVIATSKAAPVQVAPTRPAPRVEEPALQEPEEEEEATTVPVVEPRGSSILDFFRRLFDRFR
jgi:hypothetical protein